MNISLPQKTVRRFVGNNAPAVTCRDPCHGTDMAATAQDDDFEARIRESFARQELMATIGAVLTTVEPGLVEIELAHRTDLTQQHGFLHAGVVASVLDSACGYAAYSLMPAGAGVLTVEFKINLLRPASGPRFVARGEVSRRGRTLTVCMGHAFSLAPDTDARKPVAAMLSTIMTVPNDRGHAS